MIVSKAQQQKTCSIQPRLLAHLIKSKAGSAIVASTESMFHTLKRTFRLANPFHDLTVRVTRLEQYLETQHIITRIIAASSELQTALPCILQAICETADWDLGEVWYANRQVNRLYCEAIWCDPALEFPTFEKSGQAITFALGKGLPGRAWASGKPAWVPNVVVDKNFLRATIAKQEGLHAGIAIPIRTEGEVIGALTFFSRESRPIDRELLQVLDTAGTQIGLFIERKRTEQEERESDWGRAALEERRRLARDLHDSVTQTLFSASVMAEMLPVLWTHNPDQIEPGLKELHQLTRGALTEMRSLLHELRSPSATHTDLTTLLPKLVENLKCQTNIQVTLDMNLSAPPTVEIQMTLYRIVQEALNNIAKHADATQVCVRLVAEGHQFSLSIEDNGQGFNLEMIPADHYGLAIMRERAEAIGAALQIESAPNKGTRIRLHKRLAANVA